MKRTLVLICLLRYAVSSPIVPSGALQDIKPRTPNAEDTQNRKESNQTLGNLDHVEKLEFTPAAKPDMKDASLLLDTQRASAVDPQGPETCPRFRLNCRRCPLDPRCIDEGDSPFSGEADSFPRWLNPWFHQPLTPLPDEPAALTGPQLADFGDIQEHPEKQDNCALKKCGYGVGEQMCHESAVCWKGHCVCGSGFKGEGGIMERNGEAVYVDPGVACNVPCDWLFCVEVEERRQCFPDPLEELFGVSGIGVETEDEPRVEVPLASSQHHETVDVPEIFAEEEFDKVDGADGADGQGFGFGAFGVGIDLHSL